MVASPSEGSTVDATTSLLVAAPPTAGVDAERNDTRSIVKLASTVPRATIVSALPLLGLGGLPSLPEVHALSQVGRPVLQIITGFVALRLDDRTDEGAECLASPGHRAVLPKANQLDY